MQLTLGRSHNSLVRDEQQLKVPLSPGAYSDVRFQRLGEMGQGLSRQQRVEQLLGHIRPVLILPFLQLHASANCMPSQKIQVDLFCT